MQKVVETRKNSSILRDCTIQNLIHIMYLQMLSHKTLKMLLCADTLDDDEIAVSYMYPQVTFAFCKHLWEADKRTEAYR